MVAQRLAKEARNRPPLACGSRKRRPNTSSAAPVSSSPSSRPFQSASNLASLSADNEARFDALWNGLLDGDEETGAALEVLGRRLRLPHASGGLLRASFASLCATMLGPQDYLAIAARFH